MCRLRCFDAADKVAAGVEVVWPKGDVLEAGEGVGEDLEELDYDGAADAPEDCYKKELSVRTGIWGREGGNLRIMERMSNVSNLSYVL